MLECNDPFPSEAAAIIKWVPAEKCCVPVIIPECVYLKEKCEPNDRLSFIFMPNSIMHIIVIGGIYEYKL